MPQSSDKIRLARTFSEGLVEDAFAAITLSLLNCDTHLVDSSRSSRKTEKSSTNKKSRILKKNTSSQKASTGPPKVKAPVEYKSPIGKISRSGRHIRQTKQIPSYMLNPNVSASHVPPSFDPRGFKK